MQPKRRLTLCIRRSTKPIIRWLFAGRYISSIFYRFNSSCNLLPFRHLALSNLIFLGTPCWAMYLFKKFLGPFVFDTGFGSWKF